MSLTVPPKFQLRTWQSCQGTYWCHLDSPWPFPVPLAKPTTSPQNSSSVLNLMGPEDSKNSRWGQGTGQSCMLFSFFEILLWKIPGLFKSKTPAILQAASKDHYPRIHGQVCSSLLATHSLPTMPFWNKSQVLCNFIYYGFILFL